MQQTRALVRKPNPLSAFVALSGFTKALQMDASVLSQNGVNFATIVGMTQNPRGQLLEYNYKRIIAWIARPFDFNAVADQTATFTMLRRTVPFVSTQHFARMNEMLQLYAGNSWYRRFAGLLTDWMYPVGTPLPSIRDAIAWGHSDAMLTVPGLHGEQITDLGQGNPSQPKTIVIPTVVGGNFNNLGALLRAAVMGLPYDPTAFSQRHPILEVAHVSMSVPTAEPQDMFVIGDTAHAFWAITPRLTQLQSLLELPLDLLFRVEQANGRYWFTILARQIRPNDGTAATEFRRTTSILASLGTAHRLAHVDLWNAYKAMIPGANPPDRFFDLCRFDVPSVALAQAVLKELGAGLSIGTPPGDIFIGKNERRMPLSLSSSDRPSHVTIAPPRSGKTMADAVKLLQFPAPFVAICCQAGSNARLFPALARKLGGRALFYNVPDAHSPGEELRLIEAQYAAGQFFAKSVVADWVKCKAILPCALQPKVTSTDSLLGADSYVFFAYALGFIRQLIALNQQWLPFGNPKYEQKLILIVDDSTSIPYGDSTMKLGNTPKLIGDALKDTLKDIATRARGLGIWLLMNLHTTQDAQAHFAAGYFATFSGRMFLDPGGSRIGAVTAPMANDETGAPIYPYVNTAMPGNLADLFAELLQSGA